MTAHPKRSTPLLRIVTNSERTSSACDRRWFFAYHVGLTTETAAPLRQGSLVHRLLAAWYSSGMVASPIELWAAVGAPWIESRHHYVEEQTPAHLRVERHQEDQEIAIQSMGMVDHYIQHHGDHDRREWEILAVECQAGRVMRHPIKGSPIVDIIGGKRRLWVHAGQVDLVVRDRGTGMVWAVEHKTTVDNDLEGYCTKLHLDPQIRGYRWLLDEPDPRWSSPSLVSLGEVTGVIYNVLRKKVPRVPPLLKPKKEGLRPHALSQAAIDTTRDVYLAEILRHGFDPGDYWDLLEGLRSKKFFHRDTYPITEFDVVDWADDHAHWMIGRIAASRTGAHHTRQTALCQGIAQSACPYVAVCLDDGPYTRASYGTKTIRHEELVGNLAEPTAGLERVRYAMPIPRFLGSGSKKQAITSDPEPRSDPFGGEIQKSDPIESTTTTEDSWPDPFS